MAPSAQFCACLLPEKPSTSRKAPTVQAPTGTSVNIACSGWPSQTPCKKSIIFLPAGSDSPAASRRPPDWSPVRPARDAAGRRKRRSAFLAFSPPRLVMAAQRQATNQSGSRIGATAKRPPPRMPAEPAAGLAALLASARRREVIMALGPWMQRQGGEVAAMWRGRPLWAEIDLGALERNVVALRRAGDRRRVHGRRQGQRLWPRRGARGPRRPCRRRRLAGRQRRGRGRAAAPRRPRLPHPGAGLHAALGSGEGRRQRAHAHRQHAPAGAGAGERGALARAAARPSTSRSTRA